MAVYDVRDDYDDDYDVIVFASDDGELHTATHILCSPIDGRINIVDNWGELVGVVSKQHALNMIKALEKAIEFGWLK